MLLAEMNEPAQALTQFEATLAKEPGRFLRASTQRSARRPTQRKSQCQPKIFSPAAESLQQRRQTRKTRANPSAGSALAKLVRHFLMFLFATRCRRIPFRATNWEASAKALSHSAEVLGSNEDHKNFDEINSASYDRSGRMNYEQFIVEPKDATRDPLYLYFNAITFFVGGGLSSYDFLTASPKIIHLNLNEWISFDHDDTDHRTCLPDGFYPDDAALVKQTIERASQDGRDFDHEYRLLMPDNSVRCVHVVAHALRDESGGIEFVGAVMDVTTNKQAEEALRQAQADLAHVSRVTTMGELTATLAHEVNQPIAAAVTDANTCLRWLTRDQPDLNEARAAALRVVKDGTRAAEIISHVRLLFKKSAPERALVDVNEVIPRMIALLYGEAARYNVSVHAELAADLPRTMGDHVQLQQVMMNLIMNGIDAMKDVDGARELIKSHRAANEQLLVTVSDTGVGLPQQHADQIFNAFFTTKSHGTGLGLRISRSIVESHGGRLWAADNSPRGASFCFTLPSKVEAQE